MPFLGDIARFKISPKTTEYQPSIRHEVLKWMQQHPEDCQKTTYAELANTIIIPNSGISTKSIKTAIAGMAHHNMIGYHGRQHSKKKNIYINYLHPNIPKDLLESAPKPELKKVEKKTKIVDEKKTEIVKPDNHGEGKKPEQPEPQPTNIEVPLDGEVLKQGFSLTLNINFTINKGE